MSLAFPAFWNRRWRPGLVFSSLSALWLLLLTVWISWELNRPPLPACEPPEDPQIKTPHPGFAPPSVPSAPDFVPVNPFSSPFLETGLQAYKPDAHGLKHPDYPFDPHPDWMDGVPEETPADYSVDTDLVPPDIAPLRYRGLLQRPDGERVAFVEDIRTGQTERLRVGERIGNFSLRSIERTGIVWDSQTGQLFETLRRSPESEDAGLASRVIIPDDTLLEPDSTP